MKMWRNYGNSGDEKFPGKCNISKVISIFKGTSFKKAGISR
jgi:hypothetical protein